MRAFLASVRRFIGNGPALPCPALPCPAVPTALASVPALPSRQPIALIESVDREGRSLSMRSVALIDLVHARSSVPSALALAILASLDNGPTFHVINRQDTSVAHRITIIR